MRRNEGLELLTGRHLPQSSPTLRTAQLTAAIAAEPARFQCRAIKDQVMQGRGEAPHGRHTQLVSSGHGMQIRGRRVLVTHADAAKCRRRRGRRSETRDPHTRIEMPRLGARVSITQQGDVSAPVRARDKMPDECARQHAFTFVEIVAAQATESRLHSSI